MEFGYCLADEGFCGGGGGGLGHFFVDVEGLLVALAALVGGCVRGVGVEGFRDGGLG